MLYIYVIHTVDIHGSVELVIFPNDSIIPDIHKAPWYRERDLLGMCDVYPFFVLDLGGGGVTRHVGGKFLSRWGAKINSIQPLGRAGNLTLMRWPSANWRRPLFGGGSALMICLAWMYPISPLLQKRYCLFKSASLPREGVGDYRGGKGG